MYLPAPMPDYSFVSAEATLSTLGNGRRDNGSLVLSLGLVESESES